MDGTGKVLLFDLGGVLIENAMFDELRRLSGTAEPAEALIEAWLRNPVAREFELGRCDADEFADAVIAQFGLRMSRQAFLAAFAGWPKGFADGAEALLADLRRRHRVGCLSNSNVVHWRDAITEPFDFAFSSHLIGHIKPDVAAFEHVLGALGVAADEVLFFDDAESNVRAAASVGMSACRTPGFPALRQTLAELGLIARV